jgi:hypothetical protein
MLATGWSEGVLAATSAATVAKLRWSLYAEQLRSTINLDVDHQLQEIADARVDNPTRQQMLRRQRLYQASERLQSFRKIQAAAREVLYLDDPEPIPPDAPT